MNLPTYIETIGEQAAANLFGVSIWTVRSWRHRTRYPRADKAREIVEKTGGKVTFEAIYADSRDEAA